MEGKIQGRQQETGSTHEREEKTTERGTSEFCGQHAESSLGGSRNKYLPGRSQEA